MSHEDSTPFALQSPSVEEKTRYQTELIDLAGQTIGKWKVLERSEILNKKGFRSRWVCECNCGEIKHIEGGSLRGGFSKSCNACKFYPLLSRIKVGEVFGTHTVIEQVVMPKGVKALVLQCECGSRTTLPYNKVKKRSFNGCHNCPWRLKRSHWRLILKRIKFHAEQKSREFDLTVEFISELLEKQGHRCKLSGLPIGITARSRDGENTASLDRIDSLRGYVPDNVQWLHKTVNRMKLNLSDEEFVAFCRTIAAHNAKIGRDVKQDDGDESLLF